VILGKIVQIDVIDNKCVVKYGEDNEFAHHKAWRYGSINMPHDARTKTFATLKSGEEQFIAVFGSGLVNIVPNLSKQDGIDAVRMVLNRCVMDEDCDLESHRGKRRFDWIAGPDVYPMFSRKVVESQ
jgi:hypothetical protein